MGAAGNVTWAALPVASDCMRAATGCHARGKEAVGWAGWRAKRAERVYVRVCVGGGARRRCRQWCRLRANANAGCPCPVIVRCVPIPCTTCAAHAQSNEWQQHTSFPANRLHQRMRLNVLRARGPPLQPDYTPLAGAPSGWRPAAALQQHHMQHNAQGRLHQMAVKGCGWSLSTPSGPEGSVPRGSFTCRLLPHVATCQWHFHHHVRYMHAMPRPVDSTLCLGAPWVL